MYTNNLIHGEHYTHTHTSAHQNDSPVFPSLSSAASWHPSLSSPMDSQTNFYHYTLQVKKRSRGRGVYGPFNFYVASAGSSIIAQPGAAVHRGPDEMLSWHGYQSAQADRAPCPAHRKGACAAAAGLPFLSSFSLAAPNSRPPFVTGMVHLEVGVFVSGGLHSCWFPLLLLILLLVP